MVIRSATCRLDMWQSEGGGRVAEPCVATGHKCRGSAVWSWVRSDGQVYNIMFLWKCNLPFAGMRSFERGAVEWLFSQTISVVVEGKVKMSAVVTV